MCQTLAMDSKKSSPTTDKTRRKEGMRALLPATPDGRKPRQLVFADMSVEVVTLGLWLVVLLTLLVQLQLAPIAGASATRRTGASNIERGSSSTAGDSGGGGGDKCDSSVARASQCAPESVGSRATTTTTNQTTSSTTQVPPRQSMGLVTKTTGAIYRALSSVFSHSTESSAAEAEADREHGNSTTGSNSSRTLTTTPASKTIELEGSSDASKSTKRDETIEVDTEYRDVEYEETHRHLGYHAERLNPATIVAATTTKRPTTSTATTPARRLSSTAKSVKEVLKSATTTQRPAAVVATTEPAATPQPTKPLPPASNGKGGKATNGSTTGESSTRAGEMYNFINSMLKSIYLLRESALNRSTRVAPKHDDDEDALIDLNLKPAPSGKLISLTNGSEIPAGGLQLATSEDIHLLCKLLHKHLENSTTTTTLAPSTTTTTTIKETTRTSTSRPLTTRAPSSSARPPTVRPAQSSLSLDGLFVTDLRQLNETHENLLLESAFAHDLRPAQSRESTERIVQRLMLDLFAAAAKRRRMVTSSTLPPSSGGNSDYESEETGPSPSASSEGQFLVRPWPKATLSSPGQLHLVYWLLERQQESFVSSGGQKDEPSNDLDGEHRDRSGGSAVVDDASDPTRRVKAPTKEQMVKRFRVVEPREALELFDYLDHSEIQSQLNRSRLRPLVLLEAYKGAGHNHEQEAHTPDDSLAGANDSSAPSSSSMGRDHPPASAFQLLVDRLTHSSFVDNLHLYLIMFIVVLVLIILCFAIPMICCKPSSAQSKRRRSDHHQQSGNRGDAHMASQRVPTISGGILKSGATGSNQAASFMGGQSDAELAAQKAANQLSDSIWRKLSSTTTTLVRDQTEIVRNDGTISVPVTRDQVHLQQPSPLQATGGGGVLFDPLAAGESGAGRKKSQFEWYSFEEEQQQQVQRTERGENGGRRVAGRGRGGVERADQQSQTYIISDRRQITKSVQTSQMGPRAAVAPATDGSGHDDEEPMEFKSRQGSKSSDTLTKSELVMLKEKLVPIAQQHQQHTRQVASQTSDPVEPVYVNQASQATAGSATGSGEEPALGLGGYARGSTATRRRGPFDSVTRHIDSSLSSSNNESNFNKQGAATAVLVTTSSAQQQRQSANDGDNTAIERRPKMRHLELPPKTRSKVEAIKAELSKLEQRDERLAASGQRLPEAAGSEACPSSSSAATYQRFQEIP